LQDYQDFEDKSAYFTTFKDKLRVSGTSGRVGGAHRQHIYMYIHVALSVHHKNRQTDRQTDRCAVQHRDENNIHCIWELLGLEQLMWAAGVSRSPVGQQGAEGDDA